MKISKALEGKIWIWKLLKDNLDFNFSVWIKEYPNLDIFRDCINTNTFECFIRIPLNQNH